MIQINPFSVVWVNFGRGDCLRDPALLAYEQVLAPHHGWAIRKAVGAGMYFIPTKSEFLKKLNEDGEFLFHKI
jgi:hypothetical protein